MAAIPALTFPDSAYSAYLSGDVSYHTPADIYFVNQDNKPLKNLAYRDILLRDAINDVIQMVNAAFTGSTLIASSEAGHNSVRATLELLLSQALNADGTMKQSAIVAAVSASGILHAPVSIHPASSMLLQLTSATDQMLALAHEWDAVVSATPYRGSHTSVCKALIDGCRRILILDEIVNDRVFNGAGTGVVITNGNIVITNSAATKLYIVGVGTSDSVWQFNSLKIDNTGTFYGDPIKFENFTFNFESNTTPANPLIDIQCKSIQFHNIIFAHDVRTAAALTHLCKIEPANANGFVSFVNFLEDPAGTADKTNYVFFQMPNGSVTDYIKFEKVAVFNFGDFDVTVNTVEFEGVYTDTLNDSNSVQLDWRAANTTFHIVDSRIAIDTDIYFYHSGMLFLDNLSCIGPTIKSTDFDVWKDGGSAGDVYVEGDYIQTTGNFDINGHSSYPIEFHIDTLRLFTPNGAANASRFYAVYTDASHVCAVDIDDDGVPYTHAVAPIHLSNSNNIEIIAASNQVGTTTVGNYTDGVVKLDTCNYILITESNIGDDIDIILHALDSQHIDLFNNYLYFSNTNNAGGAFARKWIYLYDSLNISITRNKFVNIDSSNVWASGNALITIRREFTVYRDLVFKDNDILIPSAVNAAFYIVSSEISGVVNYSSGIRNIDIINNRVLYSDSDSDITTSVSITTARFITTNSGYIKHIRKLENHGLRGNNFETTIVDDYKASNNISHSAGTGVTMIGATKTVSNALFSGNRVFTSSVNYSSGGLDINHASDVSNVCYHDNHNPLFEAHDCDLTGIVMHDNVIQNTGASFSAFIYLHGGTTSNTLRGIAFNNNVCNVYRADTVPSDQIFILRKTNNNLTYPLSIYGLNISTNVFTVEDDGGSANYMIYIGNVSGTTSWANAIDANTSILISDNVMSVVVASVTNYLVRTDGWYNTVTPSDLRRLGIITGNIMREGLPVNGSGNYDDYGWLSKVQGAAFLKFLSAANVDAHDNFNQSTTIV